MIKVGTVAELKEKNYLIKFLEEIKDEILIFKDNNNIIRCFSSVCPHLAGEICYSKKELFCRWHGLKFTFDGIAINSKFKLSLRSYKIKDIDGVLFIE